MLNRTILGINVIIHTILNLLLDYGFLGWFRLARDDWFFLLFAGLITKLMSAEMFLFTPALAALARS